MNNQASQQYAQTKIMTASGGELVVMLYQGCIKFLRFSKKSIETNNYQQANEYLIRSQNIIMELLTTLDAERGGEVAQNLAALYEYMYRRLVKANMDKDNEIITEIEEMMIDLLESWQEAVKVDRQENGRDRLDVMTGGR